MAHGSPQEEVVARPGRGVRRRSDRAAKDFIDDTARPALVDAKVHAKDFIDDTARPALADAKVKAADKAADAKLRAAPVVAAGAAEIADRAHQAKEFAETKAAEVSGKPAKKKRSKLKLLVLLGLVAGVGAAVAKKLQGGSVESNSWQSNYSPAPPPAGAAGPGDAVGTTATGATATGATASDAVADEPVPTTGDPLTDPLPEVDPDADPENRPEA